jgi:TolB-like protein/Tfp pilus assembly protein PilF
MREKCENGSGASKNPPAPAITPDLIDSQLERILSTDRFCRSERLSWLLRRIVGRTTVESECTDAGKRLESENAVNASLRADARRLRKKLQEYYASEGRSDPLVIQLSGDPPIPVIHPRMRTATHRNLLFRSFRWIRTMTIWKALAIAAVVAVLFGPSLYRVAGFPGWKPTRAANPPSSARMGMIVLPFADLSPDKDLQYFADGLTEELIGALAKISGLHVVSRTSSFHYKGQTEDVRKIGAQFNVDLLFEGSVRVSGDKLRVIGELVNVEDGFQLWSSTYERGVEELPMPEDIARAIAETVRLRILQSGRMIVPESEGNIEAQNMYLKALHESRQRNQESLLEGIEQFEHAIRIAPNYAPPYAGLAASYCTLGAYGAFGPAEALPKAESAAAKAVALESTLGQAHAAMGIVKAARWDWGASKQEFQRAVQLSPADPEIREAYVTWCLLPLGRFDEAAKEIKRALSLDPDLASAAITSGMILHSRRRYDDAIAQFTSVIQAQPQFPAAQLALAASLLQKASYEDAMRALRRARSVTEGGAQEALLGIAFAKMGRKQSALDIIEELKQISRRRYVSPLHVAEVYSCLQDYDRAFEWLDKAHGELAPSLIYLKVNPVWDPLRPDPRYTALLQKMHLE